MAVSSAVIAAATAATSIYTGNQAAGSQKRAASQAQKQAQDASAQADRANNAASRKKPNAATINALTGGGGVSSTMLTGLNGAATTGGDLGRNTLLGA